MTNIEFIKKKNYAFILSLIIILVSIVSFATQGLNLGIDFTGGTLLHYEFEEPVDEYVIHDVLESMELTGIVQPVAGNDREVIITTSFLNDDKKRALISNLVDSLSLIAEDGIKRETDIGPTIGRELMENAFSAIIWAIIAILIYISIRFNYKFATASIIALVHDSLITIGILSLLFREINSTIIAAFLTLLGYSLNDTIVVSDRIRENTSRMKNIPFDEMVNKSINMSLTRTIHTSLTTLFPVIILFLFGGEILENFALALLIGVIAGTYSSIFVVSPVLTMWNKGRIIK
ncbi:MAG: protein translocase subunit SecF [Candidatus Muiribacteriota bacterium]